jgi:hypothetical protein
MELIMTPTEYQTMASQEAKAVEVFPKVHIILELDQQTMNRENAERHAAT